MGRLFGTDGVRGLANRDVTVELALDLSVAAARVLLESGEFSGNRPRAVVGRDTRASGEFLAAAVSAGLASAGVEVADAGVLPTPGVAYAVRASEADLGVVLSASHNPMEDNGIKFFARGGTKLPDALEDRIAARMGEEWDRPTGADVGRIRRYPAATDRYIESLVSSIGTLATLDGLNIVVDCANGAASVVGPAALRQAGASVTVIGDEPTGLNINVDSGSTHIDTLTAAVVDEGADLGVAFDGDADRCMAVDAQGRVVDGDQIMGILAVGLAEDGLLKQNTLVTTVMSNLGLWLAMADAGIEIVRTKVGDRYVLEEMLANGYCIGGEQSGHIVLLDHGSTGDGVQTALHLAARIAATSRTLADLASAVPKLPQVLVNVPDVDRDRVDDKAVTSAVTDVEKELGETGRVLLRASGTEPLIRVMVEAADEHAAQSAADSLADVVRTRLSL